MNEEETKEQGSGVELEFDLGDSPQKVWRAISIPEFRERWLPKEALVDPDAVTVTPGHEVRYKLRDNSPPFLESTVTFTITPNATGGTCLRIVHELTDARFGRMAGAAANSNSPPLMLAA
ncbi:SRPBCC family protein [Rhizobium aegyptiacum]|uniref:SRPBCC family protein n=1 Tax=Rhizobium aegyptiacum TaxID=1764550 RepID=UPI0007E542C1|nr:SRPBCC domain-containing protein [Rhizobium aegyptiacum]